MYIFNIKPYCAWSAGLLFVFLQFFLQLSIGVLLPELESSLHLNSFEVSKIAAAYYLTYVILQMPAGALLDIFGTRVLMTFGAMVCGVGCWLLSMSDSISFAIFARVFMGLGASFAFVGTIKIIDENFPSRNYSMFVGFTESLAMVVALLANIYFAKLLLAYSWRHIFAMAGLISLLISLLLWLVLPSSYNQRIGNWARLVSSMKNIVMVPALWANGIYCGLMFTLVTAFSGLWAMPFLLSVQKLPLTDVSMEASMIFLGIALGSPLSGLIYNYFENTRLVLFYSALTSLAISLWIIFLTPSNIYVGSFLFFILGVFCCGYVLNYPLATEYVAHNDRGASLGFANMLCVALVPIMQMLIGYLIKNSCAGHPGNVSISDYKTGLIVIPFSLLVALVFSFYTPKINKG